MEEQTPLRFIHVLYVPTMACNMACRYCYLEENTVDIRSGHTPSETLSYFVDKCAKENIIPFNISLHGGEVTTLPPEEFRGLIAYISDYYNRNSALIQENGFRVGRPHIKTNLFRLDCHMDTLRDYGVSISGSLDLPFSLHNEYRVTKDGKPTLDTILANIKQLEGTATLRKVSATIFREHYEHTDEIIRDIRWLHENTCLDMNDFNFMVGFEYNANGLLHAMNGEEQLDFFHRIRDAFMGTDLEPGLRGPWFAEFGPGYCTNCDNCGNKFFLLEKNGDIYSCVRGQKQPDFYYGNIYEQDMSAIMDEATRKIAAAHASVGFDAECAACPYLYICKTGCPFVKKSTGSAKSYTCDLQRELYALWGLQPSGYPRGDTSVYVATMHPELAPAYALPWLPPEIPNLNTLIQRDPMLKNIYEPGIYILEIDGERFPLESQITKQTRTVAFITEESRVLIYARESVFNDNCPWPVNNSLFIQLLSGDMVVYGDEQRLKQKHVANEMIYTGSLEKAEIDGESYLYADISPFLRAYGPCLSTERENNIFFTTNELRNYHYTKQKNNAFYHIQAINLPFHNMDFRYLTKKMLSGEENND